ncbi:MAG: hypothetical protein H7Y20_13425 [Bryobacteraceae bacterium]|nr:hypothetical protein [Bryobacteraceae bacterium]
MNATGALILAASTVFLMGCTSSSRFNTTSDHREAYLGISAPRIATLRARLAMLDFPQPKGTVERLLPPQARPVSTSVGDRFPNKAGLLAVYHYRYALSPEWDLILRQGHYATASGTHVRDDGAQIIRRRQCPKHDIRLKTARGYRPSPGTRVDPSDDYLELDHARFPFAIPFGFAPSRSDVFTVPTSVRFCPQCEQAQQRALSSRRTNAIDRLVWGGAPLPLIHRTYNSQ